MKKNTQKRISQIATLILCLAFLIKFGKPALLKTYINLTIGSCQKLPVLCAMPQEEVNANIIDQQYVAGLISYEFPELIVSVPKNIPSVQRKVIQLFYTRKPAKDKGSVIYLLYEPPGYFPDLFPEIKKIGIKNNYDFLNRVMSATTVGIKNVTDTFFVVTKTIFTPDIGDQRNLKMIKFTSGNKKGFITYNLGKTENYFDCNIIDNYGNFFKIYIKDKNAALDLDKVIAIISTIRKA